MHQRWKNVASAFQRGEFIVKAYSFARFPRSAMKWVSVTMAVVAVVPVLLLSTRRSVVHAVSTRAELVGSLPFTLVAEGERVSLDWDGQSPVVQAGECGVLWIADGDIHRRLILDESQLRAGKLFYWPINKDVSFQLKVAQGNKDCAKDVPPVLLPAESLPNHQRAGRLASGSRMHIVQKAERPSTETHESGDGTPFENTRIEPVNGPGFAVQGESQQAETLAVHAIPMSAATERSPLSIAIGPAPPVALESYTSVSVETVPEKRLSRFVSRIPLLRRLHRATERVSPKPVRETTLTIPAELRRALKPDLPMDVRAFVNESGKVTYAEMASDFTEENSDLASLAVFDARHWEFMPAQTGGQAVPAQIILRYRFGNPLLASSRDQKPDEGLRK